MSGLVDSPGAVLANRTTANAIVYADIVNMFARLAHHDSHIYYSYEL
jgi:hypothetical protein